MSIDDRENKREFCDMEWTITVQLLTRQRLMNMMPCTVNFPENNHLVVTFEMRVPCITCRGKGELGEGIYRTSCFSCWGRQLVSRGENEKNLRDIRFIS